MQQTLFSPDGKVFPTLYSRNSDGSIQQWSIEVVGPRYRTTSGRVGGVLQSPEWTDCEPKNVGKKNEKSAEESAMFDAEAKWKKKKKSEGYVEDINEVDNLTFREPMRANVYSERKHTVKFGEVDAQFKFDGFRCNPQPDTGIILSRYNNPIVGVPHINALLAPFHAECPDIKLDGELYSHLHKDDFNSICKILKRQTLGPAELQRCQVMELWIFDIVDEKLTWLERKAKLKAIFNKWYPHFGRTIRLVKTYTPVDEADYDQFHLRAIHEGFEGSMLRAHNAPYKFSRCDGLLKRKEFIDEEFEFVRVETGKGDKKGMAAKVICRDKRGVEFGANIKADWEFCCQLLKEQDEYVGTPVTVKFQNYTPVKSATEGGVPRQGYAIKFNKF